MITGARAMHLAVRTFGPRWRREDSISLEALARLTHDSIAPNGRPWGDYARAA